ncbi:MAG: DUF3293 domain-containing protein [Gemmatimonadaceae bacterium]
MSERDDDRYHDYPNTILEFFPATAPPLRVDLRRRLDGDTRDAIAQLGLGDAFAVFTAENPDGNNAEDEPTRAAEVARERGNARRQRALEEALRETGVPWLRVDGVAPTGEYREHCVAVAIPCHDAAALAERLRQLALFWYDGTRFWLLPAKASEEAVKLPGGQPLDHRQPPQPKSSN